MAVFTLSSGPSLLGHNKLLFAVLVLVVILYCAVRGHVRPNGIAHGHLSQILNSATSTRKESLYPGQKIASKGLQVEAENQRPQSYSETNPGKFRNHIRSVICTQAYLFMAVASCRVWPDHFIADPTSTCAF